MSPKLSPPSIGDVMADQGNAIDSRYHLSAATRRQLNKVFPTHWSFLLGEIAMYSFIVLLLTGVYLTLFFDPSMNDVAYNGVYQPLRGVEMSKAYASTLDISFEGYFGYSLPDDLLSGIGLRAALSSITMGMPVIGTWLHWGLFGGDFPCGGAGDDCTAAGYIIPRLYGLHILLLPGIILALIGAHLAFVWFQKHT